MAAPPVAAVLSFALTSFLIELTPGPNMAYLAVVAVSEGRRRGYAAVAGVALGLAIIGIAAALGLAELISQSPWIYQTLRWAGIAFLFYLAVDAWRDAAPDHKPRNQTNSFYFRRGLITNLLNPKAGLFFITVLPSFIDQAGPVLAQNMTLVAVYVLVATVVHGAIVALAGLLQPVLTDPRRERIVRRVLAVLLAAVAIWFGWSTRQH